MTDLTATRLPSLSERIEGAAAITLMALFKALPIDAASALGGFLARSIGPRLGITKRARRNLEIALPDIVVGALAGKSGPAWTSMLFE